MKKPSDILVQIQQRHALTAHIDCWRLTPAEGAVLPAFSAGAHIEVQIAPGIRRAYSLCSDPAQRDFYEIAVKREEAGRGGSQALHQTARTGSNLWISSPRNTFGLADTAGTHLLVGAGIGLTPMIAMAHSLYRSEADFHLVARVRSRAELPFADLLTQGPWRSRVTLSFSGEGELQLPSQPNHVYCCGPSGFMHAVRSRFTALPDAGWHQEHFGGESVEVAASGYRLKLALRNQEIEVATGQRLIDALRSHGVACNTVCEQGVCGSCVVPWTDGEPRHHDECLSNEERQTLLALCCAGCSSTSLTLEL